MGGLSSKLSTAVPELYYHPARGKAEQIRLLLSESGIEWNDVTYEPDERGEFLAKASKLGGNLTTNIPMLKLDGKCYTQSSVILRYVARRVGLFPSDVEQLYRVENLIEACEDFRIAAYKPIIPTLMGGVATDEVKDAYRSTAPKHLANFERLLLEDNIGTHDEGEARAIFFVGNRLSVADIAVYDVLSTYASRLQPTCLEDYPTLKVFFESMAVRPRIARWQSSERHRALHAFGAL